YDAPHSLPSLHSFPTRRSSDLVHEAFLNIGLVAAHGDAVEDRTDVAALAVDPVAGSARGDWAVVKQIFPPLHIARGHLHFVFTEDRKSTRLNSSHVKISYAVFC